MKKKNYIFSYIYIIATVVVIYFIISKNLDVDQLNRTISGLNYTWLAVSILSILLYWASDALLIRQIIPYIAQEKAGFPACVKYSIIGLYYGALTPFATGGQPVQIIYMKNDGIGIGKSTAIICVKSFAYSASISILYLLLIAAKGRFFYTNYPSFFWISLLGFLVNMIGLAGILTAMKYPVIARKICKSIVLVLHKIRVIQNPDKHYARVDRTIDEFASASAYVSANRGKAFVSVLISCVNMFFLLIVPYFVYRAFGFGQHVWLNMLALNTFMYMAVAFVPTPGTSLAAEVGFRLMFIIMFKNTIMLGIGLWRILTYYSILLVGSILVVVYQWIHTRYRDRTVPAGGK
mgnify:CR=1 FL=1